MSCHGLGRLLVSGAAAAAECINDQQLAFAGRRQLVDIDGRCQNLYCSDVSLVKMVFGVRGAERRWNRHAVHSAVAKRSHACVYDRTSR